jgi:hypothetical protein
MQPEVGSLEDAEVESLVLDLVASEVLGIQGRCCSEQKQRREYCVE